MSRIILIFVQEIKDIFSNPFNFVSEMPMVDLARYQNQEKLAKQVKKISLNEHDCCGGCQQEIDCVQPLCITCCHPFHDHCRKAPDLCVKCNPKLGKFISNNLMVNNRQSHYITMVCTNNN